MATLTRKALDKLEPSSDERWIADDALPGFGARVLPSGVVSFALRYRTRAGIGHRLTIGRYPILGPEEARRIAREKLGDVARGADPSQERKAAREAGWRRAETIASLAERWVEAQSARVAKGKLRAKTLREYQRELAHDILPRLGRVKLADLSRADAQGLHDALAKIPMIANRALGLLSMLWQWGDAQDPPLVSG